MKQQTGHKKEKEKIDAKVTANMLMIALYQVKKNSQKKIGKRRELYYDLLTV